MQFQKYFWLFSSLDLSVGGFVVLLLFCLQGFLCVYDFFVVCVCGFLFPFLCVWCLFFSVLLFRSCFHMLP